MLPNPQSPLLLALLLLIAALAGCHAPADNATDDGDNGDSGDGDGDAGMPMVTLTTQPTMTVTAGQAFNITVQYTIENGPIMSAHIGAHWSNNETQDNWTAANYTGASPHITEETTLDGTGSYNITGWVFAEPQTVHYRPHIMTLDGTHHFAADDYVIEVQAAS